MAQTHGIREELPWRFVRRGAYRQGRTNGGRRRCRPACRSQKGLRRGQRAMKGVPFGSGPVADPRWRVAATRHRRARFSRLSLCDVLVGAFIPERNLNNASLAAWALLIANGRAEARRAMRGIFRRRRRAISQPFSPHLVGSEAESPAIGVSDTGAGRRTRGENFKRGRAKRTSEVNSRAMRPAVDCSSR